MNYQEIKITTFDGKQTHIILDLGDGAFKSFPADEANPEYVSWAVAEGLMEAPVVAEPEAVEPVAEPVIGADPDPAP